ncbi:diguanylate cyclase [Candidatus Woesearchaeota archaeon]|nr:diguanylate cyclase [Candidatus Woesearchaeota archaeon]
MSERIRELEVVLEFIENTYVSQSLVELAQRTSDFFVNRFKLGNCAVELFGAHHRFITNSNVSRTYLLIEKRVRSILDNTRTPHFVARADDPIFSGLEELGYALSAFPIMAGKDHIGNLYLYGKTTVEHDMQLITAILIKLVKAAVHVKNYSEVKHSAISDPLTGLYNKTYFFETLKHDLARAMKEKEPTSIVIIDIDNFKNFNDTRGHMEGDILLKGLGDVLRNVALDSHTTSRFGGEEFVIHLPNTKTGEAYTWAERLRKEVETHLEATISIGVCTCLNSSASASQMMKHADEALYKSKGTGKNKTTHYLVIDRSLGVIDAEAHHVTG